MLCYILTTGKTFVYNTLTSILRGRNQNVAAAAWTGIAAQLLSSGRTLHSLFKLPVPILDNSTCNISPTTPHAAMLRDLHLIILDEASMIPAHALRAIDLLLRDLMSNDCPFGGKVIVLGGDFRQVLPVVRHATRAAIVEATLKHSPLWPVFRTLHLVENMRARKEEKEFAEWLLKVGDGTLHSEVQGACDTAITIPAQCIAQEPLINEIFDGMTAANVRDYCSCVILCPKNAKTLELNEQVLQQLPGECHTYASVDSAMCDNEEEATNYPPEFLHSLTPSGLPPHILNLKVGAVVMLLRNLNIKEGLCNGTRLMIKRLHQNVIDAEVLLGTHQSKRVLIPRVVLAPSDVDLPFVLRRRQFPVRLAWAMTINKAQGQTFEKVGIHLEEPVFTHGQLYVAFSRARSFADVRVEVIPTSRQGRHEETWTTDNLVYHEVL